MNPIYLDYAATTPLDPEVYKKVETVLRKENHYFGNPGSLHYFGQRSRSIVDFARVEIAKTIFANFREILFASSATEANNLVLRGVLDSFIKKQALKKEEKKYIPKIIVSSIEHPSVFETAKILESRQMAEVVFLPVSQDGVVSLSALEKEIDQRTILISIMWVNNETGITQPIKEVVEIVKRFKESLATNSKKLGASNKNYKNLSFYPLVHTDAVQAFNVFDLNVEKSGVDLMTLSSHKIYGPKGAAALYIKGGVDVCDFIEPIISGGGQEYGLRSGTENVESIIGFAYAARKAFKMHKEESLRLKKLSEMFFEKIKKSIPDVQINGSEKFRAPHILNLYFPQKTDLSISFDMLKLAVSGGSACSQRYEKPSYVLSAMGYDLSRIKGSVRFSFGRFTLAKDIDEAANRIIISLNK